jgi:hypothetical protein
MGWIVNCVGCTRSELPHLASCSYVLGVNVARAMVYVAVKISIAEVERDNGEIGVLHAIAAVRPTCPYLLSMHDHFQHNGPN